MASTLRSASSNLPCSHAWGRFSSIAGQMAMANIVMAQSRSGTGVSRSSIARGGQQPMLSHDGRLIVVFNGEIYNHLELKKRFEARGLLYQTRSDTETILHTYATYCNECVHELDGMFAFVLYDRERRMLFGARDRFGKKPLYPTGLPFGDLAFAFASELKSLRKCQDIQARLHLSPQALAG